ncbi:DUF6282 family protein [Chloroflexota bacterium]
MVIDITVQGAIDLHIHSYPGLKPRIADDLVISRAAAEAGMAAIMIKNAWEPTTSRAYLAQRTLNQDFPNMKIYGGIVLNSYVGGINPAAVEATLEMGGKEVWMPTFDSAHNAEEVESRTNIHAKSVLGGNENGEGIRILKDEKLIPYAIEVVELIAKHNAILSTGHLSVPEIRALVSEASKRGVSKILITHPFANVPVGAEEIVFLKDMISLGALPEFAYSTVSPMWGFAKLGQIRDAIQALGADNCIIVSDCGMKHNPMPHEALRIFAQTLYEHGISEKDIEKMIKYNPGVLLGI